MELSVVGYLAKCLWPRALSVTPTTAVREIEIELPGQGIDQHDSNSEDSSEGWDDSDSDSEPSEGEEMTEEQRQHEREQRELERIRVLEAAGLIIKQPAEGKIPPAPPVRRRSTKKGRRPPPAAPSLPATTSDLERELPPLPSQSPHAKLDDAYERYETFKNREAAIFSTANRDSVAFTNSDAGSIPPSSPRMSITPGMGAASLSPSPPILPAVNESKSGGYSSLLGFLSRSKTPGEEKRSFSVASISAPMISAPIPVTAMTTPTRENSPAFGSNWSSLLDKTALQEIPSGERKRQEAIFELINTESAYVRDLQLIVEVFYANIMPLLDDKAITVIFANIEDILLTNTAFLSQLEVRQKECRLYIDDIGDLLESHIGDMGGYMQYCVNQSSAIKILQSIREANSELAAKLQHLRENDPSVRSLDLSSYLLIPMQRLTRYPLLIRQILNYTEPSSDRDKIENSLIAAEVILAAINESIREQEGQGRLAELSKELWVGQGHLDLTAPTRFMGTRRLLKEGLLVKARSRRRLRVVLCTDILILVEEATKIVYGDPMPLSDVAIHELSDDLAFRISTSYPRGGRTINLRASSARDCQHWMTTIEQARRRYLDAEKRTMRHRRESRASRGSLGSILG